MNLNIYGLKVFIPDQNSKPKLKCKFENYQLSYEYEIDTLTEKMKFPIQIPENATFGREALHISIVDSFNQEKSDMEWFSITKVFKILKKDEVKVFKPIKNLIVPAIIIGYSNYELVTEIEDKKYECNYAEGNTLHFHECHIFLKRVDFLKCDFLVQYCIKLDKSCTIR